MDLEDAIRHALDGRALLFSGAGFSFGARNLLDEQIPAGKALAKMLLEEVGYSDRDSPLDKAAAAYLRRKNKRDLLRLLQNAFTVRHISNSHEVIAALPWRRVYTTNYDLVFEEARKKSGLPSSSVEGADSPRENMPKENLVLHINGLITRATEDTLDSSFKLISQSYAADSFENSGWAFHFRNDIRAAAALIFVGYSMYDLDIRRILFSEDISDKCVFVVAPTTSETELDAEDLADLGIVAPIGIDAFAEIVERVRGEYSPQENELLLEVWEPVAPILSASGPPADSDVIDFLVEGDIRDSLVLETTGAKRHEYLIDRPVLGKAEFKAGKGGSRMVIIGGLGTGKSFVADYLLQVYAAKGWGVFRLETAASDEISEAELICESEGSKLLLVESYHRHMDLLRWFSEVDPADVAVVLTERTHIHELLAKDLYELFPDQLQLFDISRLEQSEVESAVALFDRYGLWGDRTAWSRERKARFIANDCKGQIPFLLLDVLRSKHVTDRYRELLNGVANRSDVEELLICVFALDAMGFLPKVSVVEELLANRVRWAMLRSQPNLKPIVDFDARTVRARSAVLATYLLHHIFSAKSVVATLIGMAREADSRRVDREFTLISNNLMRYRNIAAVLPETNRLESTINFYEGVKNLPSAKRNPQFWLQYAIACLAFGQLSRAERYFEDAYSLVKANREYDTFMIDNHYARFLLEKALVVSSHTDALMLVEEAKKIFLAQMSTEVRYYPYRVALRAFACYERFSGQWTLQQKEYFKRLFEELRRRCESARGELRNQRYVVDCLGRANAALEKMSEAR